MAKEIRLSDHALLKVEILAQHGINISSEFIEEVVQVPDRLETGEDGKFTAQKGFDERLVLRVVYREFPKFIVVITVYPGRRSRYEKDSI